MSAESHPAPARPGAAALSPLRDFLQRLRRETYRAGPHVPLPASPTHLLREVAPAENLVSRFQTSAAMVGCRVHRVRRDEWLATVRGILRERSARTVLVEPHAETALTAERAAQLSEALEAEGVATSAQCVDESLFAADASVTGVISALAETGTLVCVSSAASARGASLIPPVHIALVSSSQLVADLFDFFERLGAWAELPANVNLITGPSKTADIEGVLVTGVHGPGEVHIVLTAD